MSRLNRVIGLVRSLVIYHAIPRRQDRLRRLYAGFARRGDLVFDIGAHAGNHVRSFSSLGCRVVALEPQPDFARLLRKFFSHSPDIVIVEAAAGDAPGRATLAISERTPTVTSLAHAWRDARAAEPEFGNVRWNRSIEIEVTTLDALIERFGVPAFVKIDAEGSEPAVLAGLTRAVPALSFEFLPQALDLAEVCVARLRTLGPYVFNWSIGESRRFRSPAWLSERDLLLSLRAVTVRRAGDVYARLRSERPI